MNTHLSKTLVLCLALVCLAAPALAQQAPTAGAPPDGTVQSQSPDANQNQNPDSSQSSPDNRQMPVAPIRGLFVGSDNSQTDNSGTPEPDTHALTGGEIIEMGDLARPRNLLDVAAHFGESGDTGINPGHVTSVSAVGGSLNFDRTSNRFHTEVVYNGALLEYFPTIYGLKHDQQAHTLAVLQDFEWSRWIIRLHDDFVASPQATIGGFDTGGFGGGQLGLLSTILPGLGPDETILTGYTSRVNEVGLGEVDYRLSRRSEITFSGSYGVLDFLHPGYINSYEASGRAGYNYQLDAKNTIGFVYEYSLLGYSGFSEKIDSSSGQVMFGRKVLGRLAFEVAAGPQRLELDNYGSSVHSEWAWSAYALVAYAQRRTNYSVSFTRGLVGGAGVLLGGYGDTVIGGVSRQLSRTWTVTGNGGYSHNGSVAAIHAAGLFSNYYGSANLAHNLNPRLVLTLSYGLQKQATAGVCPVANCGIVGLRQIGGATLDWHTRKIALN